MRQGRLLQDLAAATPRDPAEGAAAELRKDGPLMQTYQLPVHGHADGSVELVGEAPERIRMSQELLDVANPAVLALDGQGDVMFTLTNAVLWYRRVGPVDGDVCIIEFERVA